LPAKMTSSIFCERKRARRLLAQHPADRVDEVRFPRAVRSDDRGDAGTKSSVVASANVLKPKTLSDLRRMR
jgi:hypothetical protein